MRATLYLLVFLLISQAAICQRTPKQQINLANFAQQLFQVQDENLPYEDLYESLYQFYLNPLDINEASQEELASLYILSQEQINQFIEYREKNKPLLSIYEIQTITGFDLATIYKILPFITLNKNSGAKKPFFRRIRESDNNYLITRLETTFESRKGYLSHDSIPAPYLGSPYRFYARYRCSEPKDFSFGFTVEKDQGEQVTWRPNNKQFLMDFYSGHLILYNKGRLKSVILGDYQVLFGQGLIFGGGFGVGKGAETITTVRRSNLGIKPYTSSFEAGFYRGIAATYALGIFDLTAFYSDKNLDGSISSDNLNENSEYVSSILQTGFHRTSKEISSKQQINQKITGGNIHYAGKSKRFQAGINYLLMEYEHPVLKKENNYNKFDFKGKENINLGIYSSYTWRNFNFFGEFAASKSKGIGYVAGFVSSLSSRVEMSMLLRNYERNFHSLNSSGFGENNKNINEKGIYTGFKIIPFRQFTLNVYYDSFRFPWLNFQADAPSKGYEYLGRLSYQPSKTVVLFIQYKKEVKEKNDEEKNNSYNFLKDAIKENYVLNVEYTARNILSFQSRVQYSNAYQEKLSKGMAIAQNVNFDFKKFDFSTGFTIFDTDDFKNGQYMYEQDVLYSFSIPSLSGSGMRSYLVCHYKIIKNLDIWFKLARTTYKNQGKIGSGNEEIIGNKKTDGKVQLMFKF